MPVKDCLLSFKVHLLQALSSKNSEMCPEPKKEWNVFIFPKVPSKDQQSYDTVIEAVEAVDIATGDDRVARIELASCSS